MKRVIKPLLAIVAIALLAGAADTFVTSRLVVQQTSNLGIATASSLALSGTQPAPGLSQCNASPPIGATNKGAVCLDPYNAQPWVYTGATWANVGGATGNAYSFFGDGSSGACVLDGTTPCAGMTPSANVYSMPGDMNFTTLTVNAGVTLRTNGSVVHVQGALVDNGTIMNDGADASGATHGAGGGGNWAGVGTNGGDGAVNAGTATSGGGAPHAITLFTQGKAHAGCGLAAPGANGATGQGGGGGDSSGGCAGDGGVIGWTLSAQPPRDILLLMQAHGIGDSSALYGGTGGGGGRTDGNPGIAGGGGGGGGWCVVAAKSISGTGAIHSRGGRGANGGSGVASGGGGGGGGVVVIVTNSTLPIGVAYDATGGFGGLGVGGGVGGGRGGDGIVEVFPG